MDQVRDFFFPLLSGMAAGVSPCVIALFPMLISKVEQLRGKGGSALILLVGFLFFFVILSLFVQELLQSQFQTGIRILLGLIFCTLGLQSLLGKVSAKELPLISNQFLMGGVYAILVSYNPCTLPYLTVIVSSYAGATLALKMTIFGIGLSIPAIVIAIFGNALLQYIQQKISNVFHWINKAMAVVNIGAGAYLVVKIHKLSIYDVVIGDCGLFISFQMIFRIYFDIKKAQVLFTKKKKDENKEKKEKDKEDKKEKEKEEKKEKELELEIYKKNQRTAKIIISLVILYIILYAAGFAIGYFSIQKKFDLFLSNDEKEILAISQKRIEDNKEDQIEESDEDVNIKDIKDIKPQRIEKQEQKQQQEQKEYKEEEEEEEIPLERGEDESSEKELDEEIKVNKNKQIKSNETDNKDKDNNITDKKPTQQPIKIDCQVTGVCYECILTSWGLLILLFIGSAATLAAAWWEEKEDFRGIVEEVCAVPKFRKGKKKNKAK